MDLYLIVLFLHVAASIAMFSGWAIELAALPRQDGSSSPGAHRFAPLAPMGMLLTLFTGLAMMVWRWEVEAWMFVALAGIGILIAGGVLFEKSAAARESDRFSDAIGLRRRSVALRMGIGLAILALMVAKPDLAISLVLMGAGAVAGLGFSVMARKRAR